VGAIREIARILRALPSVELDRRRLGPTPLLAKVRARGARGAARDATERRRLQRLIRIVDALVPGGGNCYRRSLLEMALDAAAAAEPLRFGLREHGGPGSGHAWLGDRPDESARYDAEFAA
jgi:hypothetical protein